MRKSARYLAGQVVDAAARALGAYLSAWLRLILYGFLGLLAGFALGQPALIGGAVLGVAFVAELVPAVFTAFVDHRRLLADLYILVWWPLRDRIGYASPVGDGWLPDESKQAARAWLRDQVRT